MCRAPQDWSSLKRSPRFGPKCAGCEVADVFYNAWEAVRPQVQDALSKITYTSVFFTGHDMGGAIAALATYDMSVNHGAPLGRSYTFGQPRVGNKAFASELNNLQLFRVTHHTDSVVHVPPRDKGYYHSGLEVFYKEHTCTAITEDGVFQPDCVDEVLCDPNDGEDSKGANSVSASAYSYKEHDHYFGSNVRGSC
jgi:hypothetical protein